MWLSHGLLLQICRGCLSHCKAKQMHYLLYFVFEWPVLVHIFAHWRQNKHTQRHLAEAENAISNCETFCTVVVPSLYDFMSFDNETEYSGLVICERILDHLCLNLLQHVQVKFTSCNRQTFSCVMNNRLFQFHINKLH